jgi:hypothetical protein
MSSPQTSKTIEPVITAPSRGDIIFSITIPYVFPNISEKRIRAIFYSLNLGFVHSVDMVPKTDKSGKTFNKVFVHFSSQRATATNFFQKLESGEKIKIVYDKPWFWMISKSGWKNGSPHKEKRAKPYIVFDEHATQSSDELPQVERANAEEALSDTELEPNHKKHPPSPIEGKPPNPH